MKQKKLQHDDPVSSSSTSTSIPAKQTATPPAPMVTLEQVNGGGATNSSFVRASEVQVAPVRANNNNNSDNNFVGGMVTRGMVNNNEERKDKKEVVMVKEEEESEDDSSSEDEEEYEDEGDRNSSSGGSVSSGTSSPTPVESSLPTYNFVLKEPTFKPQL